MTTSPNFDEIIDRSGRLSSKWGMAERMAKVPMKDPIPMWIADSDFRCPQVVLDAAQAWMDRGIFGYAGDESAMKSATAWWLKNRHGWTIDPDWIISTAGLGNAIAMLIHTFSEPGEGIVVFPPVYHEFANKIRAADRRVVDCPLVRDGDIYSFDFEYYDTLLRGDERLLLLSSPHNPVGRVWTEKELRDLAAFAERNDLLIVSDEIHQDLVYPGHKHVPMAVACPEIVDRLITVTAASKTFNLAGMRTGLVIIEDRKIHAAYAKFVHGQNLQIAPLGCEMTMAAYSPEGAAWADAQIEYLDQSRQFFDSAMSAIPGVHSIPLQATFLAWVDFKGTGLGHEDILKRIHTKAEIVPSVGTGFGAGGEGFMRFNLATPRSVIEKAVSRLQTAFQDI